MDELLSDFLSETAEHIEGIESYLVLFEQNPHDGDAVTHIFRLVHTLKGTCGFLGLERLQSIAHAAETLIDTLRDGAPPTPIAVSLLLQAMDRIKQLVAGIAELQREPQGDDQDITGKIKSYLRGEASGEDGRPDEPKPAPALPSRPPRPQRRTKAKRTKATGQAVCEKPTAPAPSEGTGTEPAFHTSASGLGKEPEQTPARERTPDTIRISVAAIQQIMDLVSELVLTRNQIIELSRQHNIPQVKTPLERLSTVTTALQDAVMRARMQPMSRLFASIPRLVRELSVELQRKYNLVIEGADTELDRQLIETIRDPIMHLIRNCADHGIESPQDRAEAGKPETGEISIAAYYELGQVHIEVADDGRGLDAGRIREKAVERGLGSPGAIAHMSDDEVYRFILLPGFSTAKSVTQISGRGVGMDVVLSSIESIGGTISLQSRKGLGSKFILQIPLTLAIAPALIVWAGGQRFAIPQQYVVEAVTVEEDSRSLQTVQDALVLQLRDEIIPVGELATMLQLQPSAGYPDKLVIILGQRGKKFGIVTDDVAGIQEIVVQPLGPLFSSLRVFSGNTILGDGSIVLILDPTGLAEAMSVELSSGIVHTHTAERYAGAAPSNLILFKAGAGAPKAVPRSAVLRIVRAQANSIYEADGQFLYRYQDKLIPVLPAGGSGQKPDSCLILIMSLHDKTFGLWVDEVLDVVETTGELQLARSSPSVTGTMDLCGCAVEFIDTGYYYGLAYPAPQYTELHQANLLIASGEPGMQDMLSPLLASAGHHVTSAETQEQASKLLQQTNFGVIVLDAKSRDWLDESALSRGSDTLRVVLDERRQHRPGCANANDIVISPFDRRDLLDAIAAHVDAMPPDKRAAMNLNAIP